MDSYSDSYKSASLLRISLYIIIFAVSAACLLTLYDDYGNPFDLVPYLAESLTYQVGSVYGLAIVCAMVSLALLSLIFFVATVVASIREARQVRRW